MKKIILTSIIFLFLGLGLTPYVVAQTIQGPPAPGSPAAGGFVPLAPIPGLTSVDVDSAASSANLADFFNSLYKYLIGLAAVLAIIEIIAGGIQISTQDSVSKQGEGKERIQQAIFGLVLVLSPVLVFSIINPNILNLSLNLPPIDTTVAPLTNRAPAATNSFNPSYPCSASGDCAGAQASCTSAGGMTDGRRWCLNASGGFDGGGSCLEGESFVIKCMPIAAQNKDFSVAKKETYPCAANGNCDGASASCVNDGGRTGEVVCVTKDNIIDPTGKKFGFNLQGSCIDGESFAVKCIWLGAK